MAFAMVGLAALYLGFRIPYEKWLKWSYPLLFFSAGLMVLVLISGFGIKMGGAQRWINLGLFSFQPGQIAKFAIVVFVARQLELKKDRIALLNKLGIEWNSRKNQRKT